MGKKSFSAAPHGSWSSAAQFFITSLGSAVGLGNVWRFPYIVYKNGGAAFLIAYVLALIFVAVPVLLLEATIGQYAKKGAIAVWDLSPVFRGVGFATLWHCFCFVLYYNTPIAWATFYFFSSMNSQLPWKLVEGNSTNTTNFSTTITSSAESFFYNETLQLSSGVDDWGDFSWQLYLCNIAIYLLLYGGICLGPSSLGKIAYFTSIFPYVMLLIMVIFMSTLPGSEVGIDYYILQVQWEKLAEISVWRAAVSQVFFSTTCGLGTVIQLSSYNNFHHNIYRDAVIVPICDGLTSIFAGVSVFMVLGYMSQERHVGIDEVVEAGPGLIFVTYPEAFAIFRGGSAWSVFFFFMIMTLGCSSQLPMIDVCCGNISDLIPFFKKSRLHNMAFRLGFLCVCMMLTTFFYFGFGYYWYYLVDERVAGLPLMIISLCELIGVGWVYSKPFFQNRNVLLKNLEEMVGQNWSPCFRAFWAWSKYYWVISWTIVCPALLGFILVYDMATLPVLELNGYLFPAWAIDISWAIISISPGLIIAGIILIPCIRYKGYKAWLAASRPMSRWKSASCEFPSKVVQEETEL